MDTAINNHNRKALIVGHQGQAGLLMSGYLKQLGYAVLGWGRESFEGAELLGMERPSIGDPAAVAAVIQQWQPDEIYFFAALHYSSEQPPADDLELFQRSVEVNIMALIHFLHAANLHAPKTRLFYAASSRVFGALGSGMASEDTPLNPVCPYGITKAAALQACRYYRRRHSLHVSVGILFNHESKLRPVHFLSQKIIQGALAIRRGLQHTIELGSLTSGADWGYAPDTMAKIHRMVQLPEGHDFVIATGKGHSVQEFAETTFELLGLDWRNCVTIKSGILWEAHPPLAGDASKFRAACDWQDERSFRDLLRQLIIDAGGGELLV